MFCYQCEQTAKGTGCTERGVCGKNHDVASLQDLLIHGVKGLSLYALEARKSGVALDGVNRFICEACFATLTNTNFDEKRFIEMTHQCRDLCDDLKQQIADAGGKAHITEAPQCAKKETDLALLVGMGEKVGIRSDPDLDPDILSLRQLLIYGIKGISAYADHAMILGKSDDRVYLFMQEALAATLDPNLTVEDLTGLVLKCGEINLITMGLLSEANSGSYGAPVPTPVPLGQKKGKAILVSGHDLKDLDLLLKQTAGKGINIYTHGEMLPCHGYPGLKKHPHLYGHYGTAWQNQHKEFSKFPGPVLMTTNCIMKPKETYKENLFTTGVAGWPGISHLEDKDFTPVIDRALAMDGFPGDVPDKTVTVGFGHEAVLGVAGKVIEAVKNKKIRHFFLMGGCDGAKPGRNYYTEFAQKVPDDCLILHLACGKFRFFDMDMGDIDGIPRLLDVGQCNDAYSAVQIAVALAGAFDCGVNDLPLSMVISWYEQKAVAVLLTLLHLGIRDIRLGPTLPAFISPNLLNILVEKFNIMPITTPDEDLKAILG
jgi:hydroxylamine reductase